MKKVITLALVGALWFAGVAQAAIIAEEQWDAAADQRDWDIIDDPNSAGAGVETISNPGNPFNSPNSTAGGGALQIEADTAGDFAPDPDLVFTDNANPGPDGQPFIGDFTQPAGYQTDWISFDFFLNSTAEGGGFNGLQFYFVGTGGVTWYYDVDVSGQSADSWATYSVPVTGGSFTPTGWSNPALDSTLGFDSDKTSVTEIGFRLTYLTDTDGQVFGIDNLRRGYSVPEPETYAAIGFALVGLCMAFRKRITEILAVARTNMAV